MTKKIAQPILASFLFLGFTGCKQEPKDNKETNTNQVRYTENWDNLARHDEDPEWLQDAKFGIYFHWGVYSVPAFGTEWYPRFMHFESHADHKHHVKTYGHPSEFGYHDLVPLFTAEHFNADEWVDLFQKAGAKFAGPVAEHHDGFSMWDSEITPWNAKDKGPKVDITGELKKALDKRGMKLITTFHHNKHLQRYHDIRDEHLKIEDVKKAFGNSHYPLTEGMPPFTTAGDPELDYLYGNIPEERWLEEVWFGKLKEVIDKYRPDIIWFDSWLGTIPEPYKQKFCAYYLNEAQKWNKEVVMVSKRKLPEEVAIRDFEKSRLDELRSRFWMCDQTISKGSWSYTEDLDVRNGKDVLHEFIDIVSKNGVMLLNVSPKADGSIPENQQKVLLEMGEWLSKNGEAIYGTRPWYTFGEGPTSTPDVELKDAHKLYELKYTHKDIRYTKKVDKVYAIVMGMPEAGSDITLSAFNRKKMGRRFKVKSIKLLGSNAEIDYELTASGLTIKLPEGLDEEPAIAFEINTNLYW